MIKGVLKQKVKVRIMFTIDYFVSIYKDIDTLDDKFHSIPFEKVLLSMKKNHINLNYQAKKLLWNSKQ